MSHYQWLSTHVLLFYMSSDSCLQSTRRLSWRDQCTTTQIQLQSPQCAPSTCIYHISSLYTHYQCCIQRLTALGQAQGLEHQRQGLVNWSSRTRTLTTDTDIMARELGCIFWHPSTRAVNSGVKKMHPSSWALNSARELGPWTQVVETRLKSCATVRNFLLHTNTITNIYKHNEMQNVNFKTNS